MRFCLLTQNPNTYSSQALFKAVAARGAVDMLHPLKQRITWPESQPSYDVTLNRVSAVDDESFLWTLFQQPRWGRQANCWSLRQALWDKSRQALWLAQRGLPAIPFFMHRGELEESDLAWEQFRHAHQSPHGWVLKVNRGMRGVGVHFFDKTRTLFEWLETLHRINDQDFIIQPRLAPGPEFRLTLLGQETWALLERENLDGVANFAQGGKARELTSIPTDLAMLVRQLTATLWADLVSLDVLMGPSGPVVSDVNLVPGFEQLDHVTGRSLAVAVADYLSKK